MNSNSEARMLVFSMKRHCLAFTLTMSFEIFSFLSIRWSEESQNGAFIDSPSWPGRFDGSKFRSILLDRDVSPMKVLSLLKNGSETAFVKSFALRLSGFFVTVDNCRRFLRFGVFMFSFGGFSSISCTLGGSLLKSTMPEEDNDN
jgi:hypothetical protein